MLEGVLGVFAFFGTILGLASGGIMVITSLSSGNRKRAWKIVQVLAGWVAVYFILLLSFSLTSRPRYLQPGAERCFDEMCFSVQPVEIAPALGEGSQQLTASGYFYIVTIQLRSTARNKPQRPSMPDLFFIDAEGQRYTRVLNAAPLEGIEIGQPVHGDELWSERMQPGESLLRSVVVDLPADVEQPALVITEGIGPISVVIIGDENSFLHARTQFLLVP
jgi:hypothetical protein